MAKRSATTPPSSPNKMEAAQDEMKLHSVDFAVRRKSALLMALALSVHLGGCESHSFERIVLARYLTHLVHGSTHNHADELARGGVVALFTSGRCGCGLRIAKNSLTS